MVYFPDLSDSRVPSAVFIIVADSLDWFTFLYAYYIF